MPNPDEKDIEDETAELVERLRERAAIARGEKTGTALGDAIHFEEAADEIERLRARVAELEGALRDVLDSPRDGNHGKRVQGARSVLSGTPSERVAQRSEQAAHNGTVAGSTPAAFTTSDGWHDISTAPHGKSVLLYSPPVDFRRDEKFEIGCASTGERVRLPDGGTASSMSWHGSATHWMPLPAAPGTPAPPLPVAPEGTAGVWPDFTAPPQYEHPAEGWTDPALPPFRTIWEVARSCGYAVGLHGSMKRDVDLIAAPWVETPDTPKQLINSLCDALNARIIGPIESKPHGRLAATIQIDAYVKHIDISIMPAAPVPHGSQEDGKPAVGAGTEQLIDAAQAIRALGKESGS